MSGYEWRPFRKGDPLPAEAVFAGKTMGDGKTYVCRVNGEAGKVNIDGSKVHNFWCHDNGQSEAGDILCMLPGYLPHWKHKSRGDAVPDNAVLAGSTSKDGENYVCRSGGAAGKWNVDKGKLYNVWCHGNFFAKGDGDLLLIELQAADAPAPVPHHEEEHHEYHPPAPEHGYGCWNPDADCDGARAEDRVKWLMDNQGKSMADARAQVMAEFPWVFREGHGRDWWDGGADCDGIPANDRKTWLMENEGFSEHAAKLRVKSEFPGKFNGGGDWMGNGKFPHGMSIVDTHEGPKLKIEVVVNCDNVGLVAVHYQINGGAPMNFDIRHPEANKTYSHVTPHGGGYPLCKNGDRVSYWLAAEIDGLISEEPEGACPNPEARMHWTAHH